MSNDTITNLKTEIAELVEKLRHERDELNLQLHLAKAEAREEWWYLEKKWEHFQENSAIVGDAALEASQEIGAATHKLGEELKNGYQHIREAIKNAS